MLSSTFKPIVVASLLTVPEPNGHQPRSAPSLPMLKLNKTLIPPIQLTGNGKEVPLQEKTAASVSRRELIGLASTTLGGLALFAAKPAEALEVADIASSIKELFGFFKAKPKTGADNEKNSIVETEKKPKIEDKGKAKSDGDVKKPKSEAEEKKAKVEGNGNKPKVEVDEKKPKNGDDKKALTTHHSEKEKVSSTSAAAPTFPTF
ncbi:hypothetical protein K7X08_006813 [Anisodus acutangulus]|uniref:Uncharacterized protein n=1 Tax=Anisodus acutangulus TaxID=402998 RepID=A0A9Q1RRT2_9SOLA|nr:hypothetical protein K7X08_006813 [Anisodus acutangulus]